MAVNVSRKTLVLAEQETTYGGTTTLTESEDVILSYNNPIVLTRDTTMQDVQTLRSTLSNEKQLVGRSLYSVGIETCLCPIGQDYSDRYDGVDDNGAKPYFSDLLEACGMAVTGAASDSSSAVYAPVSDFPESGAGVKSCAVKVYSDGIVQEATGVYLSAAFDLTAGNAPMVSFSGQGLFSDAEAGAFPSSPAYPLDTKSLVESEGLTITVGGVSTTPICRSISFDTGTNIIERADVNSAKGLKGLTIISRSPTVSLTIEAENTYRETPSAGNATFDVDHTFSAGDLLTVAFTHSYSTTDTIAFSFPQVQLTSASMSDDGGLRVWNLDGVLLDTSASGDGDYSITFNRS